MSLNLMPNIHICLIHPEGYLHADALLDPALFFKYQFERFGVGVTFGRNLLRHGVVNYIFGAHNGFHADICKLYSCVIVNLEQMGTGGANLSPAYIDILCNELVVDYDLGNPPSYKANPDEVPIAQFGFAPYLALESLTPLEDRPIDLLFFGSMNARRRKMIALIEATGLNVTIAPVPLYGQERDELIRRAKAVINIPFYESSRFEQVRAFLCLSLGTPVLSERLSSSCPSDFFDKYVTWFDEIQLSTLFGEKFGTPSFYDEMRTQVTTFKNADPIFDFSKLMAFNSGIWQVHSQMEIGKTRQDATFEVTKSQQPLVPTLETGENSDRNGRKASKLFQYLDQSASDVDQLLSEGLFEDALRTIVIAVTNHFCQPGVINHSLYYPEFDRQIEQLSEIVTRNSSATPTVSDDNITLFVATEVFMVGGHTKVLEDCARNVKRPLIVLTDLFGTYGTDTTKQQWIFDKFEGIEIVFLSAGSLLEKTLSLNELITKRSVDSVLYFQHHQDPVAFVGTLSHIGSQKILIHHCDHNPSLGCTLTNVQHVDLSEHLRQTCQTHLDQEVKLMPLFAPDQGYRQINTIKDHNFSVVTSGRQGKFVSTGELSLQNIVKVALSAIGGSFYFIGPLPDELHESILVQLRTAGIDSHRFVPLGLVNSLWEQLLKIDASIYLGSAPMGGGRAAIEAQGAGLPTLFYTGGGEELLTSNYSVYADANLGWANLEEMAKLLLEIVPNVDALSANARLYYENNFSGLHFRRCLDELLGS